jgi:hypothetical protein
VAKVAESVKGFALLPLFCPLGLGVASDAALAWLEGGDLGLAAGHDWLEALRRLITNIYTLATGILRALGWMDNLDSIITAWLTSIP